MTPDPRLLAHPAVRKEAERLAREWHKIRCSVIRDPRTWDAEVAGYRLAHTEMFARLLSDPERAETRDWMCRSGMEADGRWRVFQREWCEYSWYWVGQAKKSHWVGNFGGSDDNKVEATDRMERNRLEYWNNLRNDPGRLVEEWLEVMR
jgi:hypothetical protein